MTEIKDGNNGIDELASELENKLYQSLGPMIYGDALYKSLGYSSADAFRQAVSRKTVPVDVFSIEKRRGKFALTRDVAKWIAEKKLFNVEEKGEDNDKKNII